MTRLDTGEYVIVEVFSAGVPPFDPNVPAIAPQSAPQSTPPSVSVPPNSRRAKSGAVAYVLWLLLGLVGVYRYYLGRVGTGVLMTLTLGGLGLWWLVDLFLIPGMLRKASGNAPTSPSTILP